MNHLQGNVAVVTGASRGIGRAAAIRLGSLGAKVVVNYLTSIEQAEDVVADIRDGGGVAVAIRADITEPSDIEMLFDAARERYGRIDTVVANAGIDSGLGPVVGIAEADFDRIYGANAKGAFFTLQTAARAVEDGGGIIYIGSAATLAPSPGFGLYASSKTPGNFLVGVLARELGARGVRVNAILPAAVDGAGYFADGAGDALRTTVEHASPLGSRMGTVDDVADAVEYLTGPLSSWISGQQLVVSGAMV